MTKEEYKEKMNELTAELEKKAGEIVQLTRQFKDEESNSVKNIGNYNDIIGFSVIARQLDYGAECVGRVYDLLNEKHTEKGLLKKIRKCLGYND